VWVLQLRVGSEEVLGSWVVRASRDLGVNSMLEGNEILMKNDLMCEIVGY
jgi:hypothetical protein